MNNTEFLRNEIFLRYGNIKRARGNFLYTEKGVRLTDLYREGGRAILGWGSEGSGAFTVFKDVLQRGLTGSFATAMTYRLQKAISELLFSERKIFVFGSRKDALLGAQKFSGDISFYKPWALTQDSSPVDFSATDCVIVEAPFPWAGETELLAVKEGLLANEAASEEKPSDACQATDIQAELGGLRTIRLAPVTEAALARSIYDLIAAIQSYSEKDFFIYDKYIAPYWLRKGPYLYPKVSKERYKDFLLFCLDCQLVPPPSYEQNGIVPFKADKGVFAKLGKSSFS
ncbi:MAG: hypothetical protein J6X67_09755 [Treponema sp.]|nr:hypothetical protein [Treponema sp.]